MRKFDGKPTSTAEAWVHELQDKNMAKEDILGELFLQFAAGSSLDRLDELLLLLSLIN